jgi:glutathione S-transferase
MSRIKLAIGNKRYSSWSLRPWLALKQCGVAFDEDVIPLDQPDTSARIAAYSSAGRVPVLIHDDLRVWDSLAICEYLNEQFPAAQLWPMDSKARALARSISAEMHSGFQTMRDRMPMKILETLAAPPMTPELQQDVDRVFQIWTDARHRFGTGGEMLFGQFTVADAMFAPVVTRLRTYGIKVHGPVAAYAAAVWNLPSMQEWIAAAKSETFRAARYETK